MLWNRLIIPPFLRGIKPVTRSAHADLIIYGADSETCQGPPFSFQFYTEDVKKEEIIVKTTSRTATRDFLKVVGQIAKHRKPVTVYVHNLEFDMPSFFYDRLSKLKDEEFKFKAYGWTVEGVYANVCFFTCTKGRKIVTFIDSYAFLKTSLAKLAVLICPHLPKLKHPEGLGKKIFSFRDKNFVAYAMRDAEIAYFVGRYLQAMHDDFDVSQCYSGPHFASRVFRRQYVTTSIPLPSKKITYSAMHSYHGGKNNLVATPGWYMDVKVLDIISAYPWAMRKLPSFYDASLYKSIEGKGHPDGPLPYFGIYKIWGEVKDCLWPSLYQHNFKKLVGYANGVWVTGPELNEAMRTGEVEIEALSGYFYEAESDLNVSPFPAYIDKFFELKDTAPNAIMRLFYKVCLLNSLYGKFIQTRGNDHHISVIHDDGTWTDERILVAGGLFNPFIASLITGIVRAEIHKLEHQYKAIHTSTDGIFSTMPMAQIKETPGLGGLKIEARGDALILRNKVYIIYNDFPLNPDRPNELKSRAYKGKYIHKYALHGFHGTVYDLEKMSLTGNAQYTYTKVNKLRESLRRNLIVNNFEKRTASLKLKR